MVFICVLAVIIAFLHFSALRFYLYWSIWWFDILLHFLAGAWVSAIALWCAFYANLQIGKRHPVWFTIIGTLFVGILWEIYEYIFGMTMVTHESYVFDTALDLGMDFFGCLAVLPLFIPQLRNSKSV